MATITTGRAVIFREPDGGYTITVFKRVGDNEEQMLQGIEGSGHPSSNLTLGNAVNTARDALNVLAVDPDKHMQIIMTTKIFTPT